MSSKNDCLSYLRNAKSELDNDSPENGQLTDSLFAIFSDFVSSDYKGVSDNKIYRLYLYTLKEILNVAFENNASKSFMRSFFKKLNTKVITDYLSSLSRSHSSDFKNTLSRMVTEFVYWQESDHKKELKLNHLTELIDNWM